MTTKFPDLEAAQIAKRAHRVEAAKSTLRENPAWFRVPAFMVWSTGSIIVASYGNEIAGHFGTGKVVLAILLALIGGALFLAGEIAALRRRLDALAVFVDLDNAA